MNELGADVLKVLEGSSLGRMSVYVLSKQSTDLGIDLDRLTAKEVGLLISRFRSVLPFFLADETEAVISRLRKLTNGQVM